MRLSPPSASASEFLSAKFLDRSFLPMKIQEMRMQGKTIATVNGSFDLLHAGHLEIIYQASLQADVLIVALNSDASIQQYKGSNRPIIPLIFRMQMMAALAMVDYVTFFVEPDPRALLEEIQPDVHVNGAEYGPHCIEAEVVRQGGGRVHIVPLVPSLSTTAIVQKIVRMGIV